jgi:hypothetical protein
MMRLLGILCAVAALVLACAGCYGPSPSLNPKINWKVTMPDLTADPTAVALPYIKSGTVLLINGDDIANLADEDRIVGVDWSQKPAVGTFLSQDTLTTTWAAPALAKTDPPLPVDLTVSLITQKGGKSTNVIHLIVLPPS